MNWELLGREPLLSWNFAGGSEETRRFQPASCLAHLGTRCNRTRIEVYCYVTARPTSSLQAVRAASRFVCGLSKPSGKKSPR
jgi:hypothetical protein